MDIQNVHCVNQDVYMVIHTVQTHNGLQYWQSLTAWIATGNTPIPASQVSPNIAIDAQIVSLEGKTERGMRESMLYVLVSIAAAQGITEPHLYAANYGYRKARDLDNAISALRAQRAGDTSTAAACDVAAVDMLNFTANAAVMNATTGAETKAAVMLEWRRIALALTTTAPTAASAFAGMGM